MKVSKRVEMYVRNAINEKYKDYGAKEEKEYNDYVRSIEEYANEQAAEANYRIISKFPELLTAFNNRDKNGYRWSHLPELTYSSNSFEYCEQYKKHTDAINKRCELIENGINNVLLSLELDKASLSELDDIISKA